jgi:hypothetical protein
MKIVITHQVYIKGEGTGRFDLCMKGMHTGDLHA